MNRARRDEWRAYLGERTGTYEYRTLRYAVVYDRLLELGLKDGDLILDLGAGMCEFARYAYSSRGWSGQYVPVDGAIDGCDLEVWLAEAGQADYAIAIEVIEHLENPLRFLQEMYFAATKGIVVTTPNAETVDVVALDRTHVSPVDAKRMEAWGLEHQAVKLFGKPDDTLVGWMQTSHPAHRMAIENLLLP